MGAAAVATSHKGQHHTRRHYLGNLSEHTVFEGEVVGIVLALDIIRQEPRIKKATILLDNQAAIKAVHKQGPQPGQYLIHLFQSELDKLLTAKPHLSIHLAWIPGHSGVEGNEWADTEAKAAAEGNSTPLSRRIPALLHTLPRSVAALKAQHKQQTAVQWEERWRNTKRAKHMSKFDRSPPGKRTLQFYANLPRRSCSILTQLRTGHIGLNRFLFRINAVTSPLCALCRTPETVDHFILHCRRFTKERHVLRKTLKKSLNLHMLLGKPKHVTKLLRYVHSTERFPAYHDYYDATNGLQVHPS